MSKYIIVLVIAFYSFQFTKSQSNEVSKLKWYSFSDLSELQKKEPRKIMIDMYTDWCVWCKKMDQQTYSHPIIVDYLNKYFYPVKFNAETSDSISFQGHSFINEGKDPHSTHQLALAFFQSTKQQIAYPTMFYLDENLNLITPYAGYLDAAHLEVLLHYIVEEKYKPITLEQYKKTFISKINAENSNMH